ncbi:hypothetical protein WJX73_010643 [Symbiochloris irregularis]|uniref:Uncharacterized protein n=1 Tax=Symbiochloris irregularis TaxID=706552 RepID=A0AAW1P4B0_9CHLO
MGWHDKKHWRGEVERSARVSKDIPLKDDVIGVKLYQWIPWLCYLDWHIRPWVYFDSVPHMVAWYGSFGFYFGCPWFIVGSFAAIAPAILNTDTDVPHSGHCGGNAWDILVLDFFLIGAVIWTPACYCQMLDGANHGYEGRWEEWLMGGSQGKKPKYRWLAFEPRSLEWWGGTIYFLGILTFVIPAVAGIVFDCNGRSAIVKTWLYDYMYMAGGVAFFLGGVFYIMAWESLWLLPGIIPMSLPDIKSFRWWGLFLYFWGGVCFIVSGAFFYWLTPEHYTLSMLEYQIELGIGYGGGTVLYMVGAALLLCRLSRARCRRSYHMIHNRLEPTNAPTEEFPHAPIPIVPLRYSLDKALVEPLSSWRNVSVEQARQIIKERVAEFEKTGKDPFVRHSFHPTVNQQLPYGLPSSHAKGVSGLMRTSYVPANYLPTRQPNAPYQQAIFLLGFAA